MNVKRVYRLYTEEGLQLRHKTPKCRVAAKLREDRRPPAAPNQVWAMDFLSDQLFNGRTIRILTIVDAYSRLSPAIDVRASYRGTDVVETLERVTGLHGTPQTIRLDNDRPQAVMAATPASFRMCYRPEFVSEALDLWAWLNGVTLDFSRPGKPTDNAFIESFNGSFRAECLNASWFLSLADARAKCEAWRTDCNQFRPHSSISQKTPIELAKTSRPACWP
ncbi:MAG: transposase family protein [Chloroflexi bacterium]|nr:transposase family protein [Chloroflexota bacterium]